MQRDERRPNYSQPVTIEEMAILAAKRVEFILSLLLVSVLACAFALHAQALPPTPHTPDLLGIYPGMPLNEAQATLQKHSSAAYVQAIAGIRC